VIGNRPPRPSPPTWFIVVLVAAIVAHVTTFALVSMHCDGVVVAALRVPVYACVQEADRE